MIFKHSTRMFFLNPLTPILKYYTESLRVEEDGIYLTRGIIKKQTIFIPFSKINSIVVYQGLFAKMFGVGNIGIFSANAQTPEIFNTVDLPWEIEKYIRQKMEVRKNE